MSRGDVVLITAVADGNIQVAVRSESKRAAIVVALRVVYFQDHSFAAHVGLAAVCIDLEFGNPDKVVPAGSRLWTARIGRGGVENVEFAIGLKIRVKGKAQ